ncbi:MAG: trypsin-like peptidase domain-containing protein [Victivallales bacterium]
MRYLFSIAACFMLLGFILKAEPLPDNVLKKVKAAAVLVKTTGASGSGFLFNKVGNSGFVATNAHVVGNDKNGVWIVFDSGDAGQVELSGAIVAFDGKLDLAIVKVESAKLPESLSLADEKAAAVTEKAYVSGFPFGEALSKKQDIKPSITIGLAEITAFEKGDDGVLRRIVLHGDLNPGCSGGALVNADGAVLGIIVEGVWTTQIGAAIPASRLSDFIRGSVKSTAVEIDSWKGGNVQLKITASVNDPFGGIAGLKFVMVPKDSIKTMPASVDGSLNYSPVTKESGAYAGLVRSGTSMNAVFKMPAQDGKDMVCMYQYEIQTKSGVLLRTMPEEYALMAPQTNMPDVNIPGRSAIEKTFEISGFKMHSLKNDIGGYVVPGADGNCVYTLKQGREGIVYKILLPSLDIERTSVLKGGTGMATNIALSSAGLLVSTYENNKSMPLQILDPKTLALKGEIPVPNIGVYKIISASGSKIAAAVEPSGGTMAVVDLESKKASKVKVAVALTPSAETLSVVDSESLKKSSPRQYVRSIGNPAVSPDGRYFYFFDGRIRKFEVSTRGLTLVASGPERKKDNTESLIYPLQLSPDGKYIALPAYNITIYTTSNMTDELTRISKSPDRAQGGMFFDMNKELIYHGLQIYDFKGSPLGNFPMGDYRDSKPDFNAYGSAMTPDGRFLFVISGGLYCIDLSSKMDTAEPKKNIGEKDQEAQVPKKSADVQKLSPSQINILNKKLDIGDLSLSIYKGGHLPKICPAREGKGFYIFNNGENLLRKISPDGNVEAIVKVPGGMDFQDSFNLSKAGVTIKTHNKICVFDEKTLDLCRSIDVSSEEKLIASPSFITSPGSEFGLLIQQSRSELTLSFVDLSKGKITNTVNADKIRAANPFPGTGKMKDPSGVCYKLDIKMFSNDGKWLIADCNGIISACKLNGSTPSPAYYFCDVGFAGLFGDMAVFRRGNGGEEAGTGYDIYNLTNPGDKKISLASMPYSTVIKLDNEKKTVMLATTKSSSPAFLTYGFGGTLISEILRPSFLADQTYCLNGDTVLISSIDSVSVLDFGVKQAESKKAVDPSVTEPVKDVIERTVKIPDGEYVVLKPPYNTAQSACWSSDGVFFYVISGRRIGKFSYPEISLVASANLDGVGKYIEKSKEGLIVLSPEIFSLLILDEKDLSAKGKINVAGADRVVCGQDSDIALLYEYNHSSGNPPRLVDLKKRKLAGIFDYFKLLPKKLMMGGHPIFLMSPDGSLIIMESNNNIVRFSKDGDSFNFEEVSPTSEESLEWMVSDQEFKNLMIGGRIVGDRPHREKAELNEKSIKPGIYVFDPKNLKKPQREIRSGYWSCEAIDSVLGVFYGSGKPRLGHKDIILLGGGSGTSVCQLDNGAPMGIYNLDAMGNSVMGEMKVLRWGLGNGKDAPTPEKKDTKLDSVPVELAPGLKAVKTVFNRLEYTKCAWSADGDCAYFSYGDGTISKIRLADSVEEFRLVLGTKNEGNMITGLAMTKLGLAACVRKTREILLLSPDDLHVLDRMPLPFDGELYSNADSSFVVLVAQYYLAGIDLQSKRMKDVIQYPGRSNANCSTFSPATRTCYVKTPERILEFSVNTEMLLSVKTIKQVDISSPMRMISQLVTSNDGMYFTFFPQSNSGIKDISCSKDALLVFKHDDMEKPSIVLDTNTRITNMAIDSAQKTVYLCDNEKLYVKKSSGMESYKVWGKDESVSGLYLHPEGGRLMIITRRGYVFIDGRTQ